MMTEQEAEWLEQACFIEEEAPHSKFLNRVSRLARRARNAFQQSVQLTGAWCPKCNLPPDEFGDCIRCGEPIAPATNA